MRSRFSNLAAQSVVAAVLLAFLALIGRLVFINAQHGPRLLAQAGRQHRSDIPIPGRRGFIVDDYGRIIAGTTLRKSVFTDPHVLPDKQHAAETVGGILGIDPGELVPDLLAAGERRFFVIRRGVTEREADLIDGSAIFGLGTFTEPYRIYPMNGLAAALVGFVSPDGVGVSGLEHQCNHWLQGENGVKTIVCDASRRAFWLAEEGYRPARDGVHVVLTIDAEIQAFAERELDAAIRKFEAESGLAIVMNPQTGAILAMANSPGFDPNDYRDYSTSRYRNRCLTDPYEPGSTFKPFIAAGALAEGLVNFGETFDCENGAWQDGPRTLRDHHPYGYLSFEDILIKSSNIGMGKIGKRLGNPALYKYVKAFGFGERSGIDLLGEDAGIVRPLAEWNTYTTTSIPMGQEIAVTPLQITRAFCAFANGGRLVKPYVIRALMDAQGRILNDLTPPPSDVQAIPENIAQVMRDRILCEVINQSPHSAVKLRNYQLFGKTGTAQIAKKSGKGYEPNAYVSSFVGGAPAGNPRLVAFVAIRRPKKSIGYYGAIVAAPVAREILGHALGYLQVPPERTEGDVAAMSEGEEIE